MSLLFSETAQTFSFVLPMLNLAFFAGYGVELILLIPSLRPYTVALRWTFLGLGIAFGVFLIYLHIELSGLVMALENR